MVETSAAVVAREPTGRPRDPSRDEAIREATLDLLTEVGYDRLTIEAVAARARAGKATLYRRWASKADLVVDALLHLDALPPDGSRQPCPEEPSGEGLRASLMRLACDTIGMSDPRRVRLVAAMATALRTDPQIGPIWRERLLEPRLADLRACFRAAQQRELDPDADIESAVAALPALMLYHVLFTDDPTDEALVARVIDGVVLPAVGVRAPTGSSRSAPATTTPGPQGAVHDGRNPCS